MQYSSFNGAYIEENTEQIERKSYDIPTDMNQWKEIVSKTPVIVIYMWSNTCRPCHMIRDKYEMLAHQFQNKNVLFFKDNIDLPTSFHKRQIEVVPTFFLLCDRHEMNHPEYKSVYNGWSEEELKKSIQYHMSQSTRMNQMEEKEEKTEPELYCYNNVCYIKK